ncbi:hypothetical protein Tco_1058146 [Tanacetum coccineum]|uniref:Uncharacterized protein n=1 Tax=Tanacetum coccineum TaxID=301880 RepID=A0ABQ5H8R4_9ASTR
MSVRPVWRKKLNYCNTSNEVDVNLPTPMPKSQSPLKEPSQEKPPTTQSNHDSLQSLLFPLSDNQTQPPPPPSLSREILTDDINLLQDLSNLLAMHLSQCNTPLSPYSPNLPHTLNLDEVEQHVGYCPCCIFTQKQFRTLSEDINWIEFLLTRPQPPLQVQRDYPPTTTSATNSPPTTN